MDTVSINKGTLYTVAAPSGAGKTSLVKALVDSIDTLKVSISYTTRVARDGEIEGMNYHFVDEATFTGMIATGDFLEYAKVFQHYYGTSNRWVGRQLEKGNDVILEIDWQGVRQIKQLFPECIRIFILPPSMQVLTDRLQGRGQDEPEVIAARMRAARDEISHYKESDLLVVNDNFQQTLQNLTDFIQDNSMPEQKHLSESQAIAERLLDCK